MISNDLVYGIATCEQPQWKECVETWRTTASRDYESIVAMKMEITEAYQRIYEFPSSAPIIAYLHDDLRIEESGWDKRVLHEFENPKVGIVGFAGAPGHGHPMMYEQPYNACALGRVGFKSNMRNAEVHGARFNGSCEVAVLDGMALFVRRALLDKIGGWPKFDESPIGYFCYDYWICCMAHRHDYKIRLVGVDCDHLSGRSTGLNPNLRVNFEEAHRWLYDNCKDVLPWSCQ